MNYERKRSSSNKILPPLMPQPPSGLLDTSRVNKRRIFYSIDK